ncbi:MAG: hypothetical protein N2689_08900, partial [Verrucomicrobiae bacterium]|nr:hypothetical protein [Verrucomicrobiae bacterium]
LVPSGQVFVVGDNRQADLDAHLHGLVATRLGSIPKADARVEIGGARLIVQRVAKNRIAELRLEKPAAEGG